MEGIPRLKMIYFPMKEIYDPVDFDPLKKYVSDHYDESPGDYEHEFTELQNLRKSACSPSPDMAGLNVMKRYFCQLHLLRGRFPMEEGEACAIAFSWEDVYQKMPVVSADIRFEEMSTLFNIGSLHSRLGAREMRTESESMKVACTHFQCAAWAFQKIVELSGAHVAWTPDCEPVLLKFKSNLMLGQAQECILEKSILDHRKSAIAAKVAQQLVDFYQNCLLTLTSDSVISVVSSRQHKEWKRSCELKRHYYQAVAYLSMGEAADEGQRYGERLAWFNAAVASLEEAQKVAKDMKDDAISETLRFAFDVIGGRQANAKKENDLIYTERIPDLHSLPEIRAASLVKGLGFETSDKEICGQDIFRRLVPMATHAASSVYSEEKAKLLRKLTEEVEAKNAWMDDFLSSLAIGQAHPVDPSIPQELLDCCAKLRTRMTAEHGESEAPSDGHSTATSEATAALRRLVDVSVDLESNLGQVESCLTDDNEREAQFRAKFPKAPPSPGTSELTAGRAELDELQASMSEARTANAALRAALERELRNVAQLLKPPAEILAGLPSVRRVTEEAEARKVLAEVTRLLGVVDDMRSQRTKLIDQLRQDLLQDDITQLLIAGSGTAAAAGLEKSEAEQAEVYAEQLKKHDRVVAFLRQNMSAQENVAKKLEEVYVQFAPVKRRLEETERERTTQVSALCRTYEAYTSALEKAEEGVSFYERTSTSLKRVSARMERILVARRQMREQYEAKMAPKPAPPPQPALPQQPLAAQPGSEAAGAGGAPPGFLLAAVAAAADYDADQSSAARVAPKIDLPSDGIPRLKDFLPHMKPKTFGRDAKNPSPVPQPPAPVSTNPMNPGVPPIPANAMNPGVPPNPMNPGVPTNAMNTGVPTNPVNVGSTPGASFTVPHQVPHHPTGYIQGLPAYSHASAAFAFQPTTSPALSKSNPSAPTTPVSSANAPIPATTIAANSDQDTRVFLPWYEGQQRAWAFYNMPAEARMLYSVANRPTPTPAIDAPMSASTLNMQTVMSHRANSMQLPMSGAAGEVISTAPSSMSHIYGQHSAQPTTHHVTVESIPMTPPTQPHPTATTTNQQQPANNPAPHQQPTNNPSPHQQPRTSSPLHQYYGPQSQFSPSHQRFPQPTYTTNQAYPAGYPYHGQSNPPTTGQQQAMQFAQYPPANPTGQATSRSESPQRFPQPYPQQHPSQSIAPTSQYQTQTSQLPNSHQHAPSSYQQPHNYPNQLPHSMYQQFPQQNATQQPSTGQPQIHPQQPPTAQPQRHPQQSLPGQPQIHPQQPSTGQPQMHPQQPSTGQPQMHPQQPSTGQPQMRPQLPTAQPQLHTQPSTGQPQMHPQQPPTGQPQMRPQLPTVQPQLHPQQPSTGQPQLHPQQPSTGQPQMHPQPPTGQPQMLPQQPPTGQPQMHPQPPTGQPQMHPQQPPTGQTQMHPQQPSTRQPQMHPQQPTAQPQLHPQPPSTAQPQMHPLQATSQPPIRPQLPTAQHQMLPQQQQIRPQQPPTPQSQMLPQKPTAYPPQPNPVASQAHLSQYHQMPSYSYQQTYSGYPQSQQQANVPNSSFPGTPGLPYSIPPQQPSPNQPPTTSYNSSNAGQLELHYNNSSIQSSQKDLLSSSPLAPEPLETPSPDPGAVLTPKVLTREELEEQQAEETRLKKLAAVREASKRDPLDDNLNLNTFIAEVERFNRRLTELERYDSGELYNAWKALSDGSKNFPKKSMAIGRMYPMKNRFPEQVPYDENRVILKDAKDDYTNAAHIDISGIDGLGDSACCPKFIVAQAPLPTTLSDFWAMVLEQGCEVVAMLACPAVADVPQAVRLPPHWPEKKGEVRRFGQLEVLVQAQKEKEWWTERVLTVRRGMGLQTRTVVHLQFNDLLGAGGAKGGNPASAEGFASLANEVRALYKQQRSPIKPIAVLCGSGAGVSGTLVALYAAMLHIETSGRLPALPAIVLHLWEQRQGLVEEQEQLLLLYRAVAHFANDLLAKRNIVVSHGRKARPPSITQASSELSIPPSIPSSIPSQLPSSVPQPQEEIPPQATSDAPKESSLTELATNFSDLELSSGSMQRKFTRRDFLEHRSGPQSLLAANATTDPSDPFAGIDPLWSMKK